MESRGAERRGRTERAEILNREEAVRDTCNAMRTEGVRPLSPLPSVWTGSPDVHEGVVDMSGGTLSLPFLLKVAGVLLRAGPPTSPPLLYLWMGATRGGQGKQGGDMQLQELSLLDRIPVV